MLFTHEHQELERTTVKIIEEHINPHIDEWEKAEIYPAHQVMKTFAEAGLLGIGKPAEYGGLDLDFSYEIRPAYWVLVAGLVMLLAKGVGALRSKRSSRLVRQAAE